MVKQLQGVIKMVPIFACIRRYINNTPWVRWEWNGERGEACLRAIQRHVCVREHGWIACFNRVEEEEEEAGTVRIFPVGHTRHVHVRRRERWRKTLRKSKAKHAEKKKKLHFSWRERKKSTRTIIRIMLKSRISQELHIFSPFQGVRSNKVDSCSKRNPCQNDGKCLPTDSGPICDCAHVEGFEGRFCHQGMCSQRLNTRVYFWMLK